MSDHYAWCAAYEQTRREQDAEALRRKEWTCFTQPNWSKKRPKTKGE